MVLRAPSGVPRPAGVARPPRHVARVVCWTNGKPAELERGSGNVDRSLSSTIVTFPGEDAPGTGLRHLPDPQEAQLTGKERHAMRTTHECYEAFPFELHASCPLGVDDSQPTGVSARQLPDAGPTSGPRHRPQPVDGGHFLTDPSLPKTVSSRLRELEIRHRC